MFILTALPKGHMHLFNFGSNYDCANYKALTVCYVSHVNRMYYYLVVVAQLGFSTVME